MHTICLVNMISYRLPGISSVNLPVHVVAEVGSVYFPSENIVPFCIMIVINEKVTSEKEQDPQHGAID